MKSLPRTERRRVFLIHSIRFGRFFSVWEGELQRVALEEEEDDAGGSVNKSDRGIETLGTAK